MQISGPQQYIGVKLQSTPSFGGLTHVFKNKLFSNADTYERLMVSAEKQPYIGSLPKEIIDTISFLTHSKEEKLTAIKQIMEAFSRAARELNGTYRGNDSISFIKAKKKDFIPKQKEAAKRASRILTSEFKDMGLLKKGERIIVSRFNENEGMYGIVYNISFPKRTNWGRKVIKLFKDFSKAPDYNDRAPIHGLMAESNAAMYIQRQQRQGYKQSVFTQPYFTSIKDNFMLLENVNNFTKQTCDKYKLSKVFEKLNIFSDDVKPIHNLNIFNGRIYDYGGFMLKNNNLSQSANKVFLALRRAEIKSINTGSDAPLIEALIKYVKGSQKETKVSRFDADSGVEAFIANSVFSEATKDILVKLKLFKPEQICTY